MNRADNGTRVSDSSTSLQVPSDGLGGYTIVGNPNAFGTSAGKIISNTEPNAQALLEALTADVRMGFKLDTLPTAGAYKGLAWRGDGTANNYYALRITQGGNDLTWFRKVAGVGPVVDTKTITVAAGDIIEVEHNASTLKFYRNGSLITGWNTSSSGIFADDNTVRGTKHGLFTSADSTGKWDDLVITDIGSVNAGTITVTNFTVSTITLSTAAASGGTSPYTYQWQRAPDVADSPGSFANVGSPGLSLVDTGLTAGTRYWYRVVVTDNVSATATSSNISQTTAGGSSVVVPITDPNWRADPGVWWSVGGSGTMPASNIRPTGTTSIVSANQGAKLKTPKFTGSLSCTLDLISNHLSSALGVRWRKNGGAWSSEIPVGSATTAVIVSGLSGTNEIEFILSRVGGAADAFTLPLDSTPADILRVVSLTLNPGATIIGPPTTRLKNIIAYGDSNLMDNGDLDSTKSWIAIAGTGLGAEYGAIDYGSTAYASGTVTAQNVPHVFEFDGTGFDSKYATGQDRAVDPAPDIVFLTHGAKDIQTVQTQAAVIARLWTNSTTGQLPTLRARWPGALIVLCVPICRGNLATGTIVDALTAAVTLMNDPRVILFDAGTTLAAGFSPTATAGAATAYSTDGVHMNGTAHQLYGDAITTFVSNFLGPSGSGSGSGGTRFQDLPVALSATDADEFLMVRTVSGTAISNRIGRGAMLAGALTVGPQGLPGTAGAGGAAGATGPAGSAGPGVPSGGSAGLSLFKIDATDFNTIWRRPASGVDVASFATAGAGTQGSPWTGWDTAITWAARTRYNCRPGYYAYATAPNLLFEGIEIIGEPGTFWIHTGTGNAFVMDAGASTGVWVPNVRVENIQVNGSPTLLTGTLSVTSGAAAVTGSGTAFLSQVAVGDAISFSYGTSNNRSYIVLAIADDTHLTINRNATVTEAAVNAKVTKTRNGFFLRGVIRGVFDRLRAHDVAVAGLWTEACVTNSLRDFRVSTFGPTDIQFQCRPQYGIVTQGRSTDWSTTWNMEETVIEGTQIYGIWLTANSYGTTIINGTSEINIGVGIQIDGGSNKLIGIDVESNTGGDIIFGASANTNELSSVFSTGTITCAGSRNNFFGGRYQNLTISSGGVGNFVIGPTFAGTFTDSGTTTVYITKTATDYTSYIGIPLPVLAAITASGSMATNCLLGNLFLVTMNADATLNAPSNPLPGMEITYRFDNNSGTTKNITWNAIFTALTGLVLPATIATGKSIYVRFRYNSFFVTWQAVQVAGTDITTLGTITAGVWNGTALTAAYVPALNALTAPTGDLSLNSHKITSLTDPTSAQDAATKAYVDAAAVGLDVKPSVRAATTGNITLSGAQTIDGVSVIAGDRVLVKAQSTGANNGIYLAASGAWTRTTDADTSAEVTSGMFTFVSEGTVNGGTGWILTTADPITLATTALTFAQFSGAGTYTNGTGLTLTGTQFSIAAGAITNAMLAGSIAASKLVGSDITTIGTLVAGSIPYSLVTGGPSAVSGANPTASVGLTAVNGSASTYLRSDGAPALDQSIAPTWTGAHIYATAARSSGVAPYHRIVTPADTAQTASTESIGIAFGGTNASPPATVTRTYATGALTTHREYLFTAPTLSAPGSTVVTNAATVVITGAPNPAGSLTITNPYALWVQASKSQFDGSLVCSSLIGSQNAVTSFSSANGAAGIATSLSMTLDFTGTVAALVFGNGSDTAIRKIVGGVIGVQTSSTKGGWLQNTAGRARLTAAVTNATTTLANLSFDHDMTLIAGRKYTGFISIPLNQATAADGFKLDLSGGTATMTSIEFGFSEALGCTIGVRTSTALATAITLTALPDTSDVWITIPVTLVCNAAGTLIPRQAKNSDAGGATMTLRTGAFFWLEDMPA